MGLGYLSIGTVAEPIKTKIKQKEKSFKEFLSNAFAILKSDRQLQVQIFTFLLAYSYLFALPFVIVEAKQKISLNGVAIGWLITSQMVGAMLSNIVWGKLSSYGKNKLIAQITIFTTIVALSMLFFINSLYGYLVLFFLVGSAVDGNRIASSNLLLIIAPEDKRPIYSALQVNIVSFGMFFSILGGIILTFTSYMALYCFAILLLCVAFWSSFKLID